jgi:benzodiazapine receptor
MKADTSRLRYLPLFISILITQAVGIASAYFTLPEVEGWYSTLRKPAFTPPDNFFAPIWTVLYVLIGISAYLVWQRRNDAIQYKISVGVYAIQLLLNFLWAIIFFGMHQILGGLIDTILLWIVIIINIICFRKFNSGAAWLLAPYLLWTSFAIVLNFWFFMLNR